MSKRFKNALEVYNRFTGIMSIAYVIRESCRECSLEGVPLETDPAIRLMAYKLANITNTDSLNRIYHGVDDLVMECTKKSGNFSHVGNTDIRDFLLADLFSVDVFESYTFDRIADVLDRVLDDHLRTEDIESLSSGHLAKLVTHYEAACAGFGSRNKVMCQENLKHYYAE